MYNTESSMAFDDMVIKGVRTLHNEIIIILFIKSFYHQPRGMLRGQLFIGVSDISINSSALLHPHHLPTAVYFHNSLSA